MYSYYGICKNVVDGDTFDIELDLGFSLKLNHRFRLLGADTPESWRPINEAERIHANEATEFVSSKILDRRILVKTEKLGVYGRYLAEIWLLSDDDVPLVNLAELLIAKNLIKDRNAYLSSEIG